jgi:methyltransferase (TIGR00027 family)
MYSGRKKMSLNEKISETAMAITSLRALSNYETDATVRCHDRFAEIFLPEDRQAALKTLGSREMIRQKIPRGMYEYVIARTKYLDGVFVDAINNSIEQIVFLGAGFDSRPYRFHALITNTMIFELDMKPTQDHKLGCLRNNNVDIHDNISFIPLNFETDDPIDMLGRHGYDRSKQTLFLWEGVTFYLSHAAVTRMLRNVKENSGFRSRVCFDFQTILKDSDLIQTGLEDEVIKFGIEAGKIVDFVDDHQYRILEHITAAEIERRFLMLHDGSLFGAIMPMMNFLHLKHEYIGN